MNQPVTKVFFLFVQWQLTVEKAPVCHCEERFFKDAPFILSYRRHGSIKQEVIIITGIPMTYYLK
jgi:hypothetical protein